MAILSLLEIGEGGVMADVAEELESKLPLDEQDAPLEANGRLIDELGSRFWQL